MRADLHFAIRPHCCSISSGGFAARLCRFYPKGLKNPPALIISICNAPIPTVHPLRKVVETTIYGVS